MASFPMREGHLDISIHTGIEWSGRDCSDTSTSQRRPRNSGENWKREEARKDPSHRFRGSMVSLTLDSQPPEP